MIYVHFGHETADVATDRADTERRRDRRLLGVVDRDPLVDHRVRFLRRPGPWRKAELSARAEGVGEFLRLGIIAARDTEHAQLVARLDFGKLDLVRSWKRRTHALDGNATARSPVLRGTLRARSLRRGGFGVSVKDDIIKMLQSGARVHVPEEPVDERLQAWAANLSRAYQELGDVATKLAEHVDRLDAKIAALERQMRGEAVITRGAESPTTRS
jgi:hypothetical protein